MAEADREQYDRAAERHPLTFYVDYLRERYGTAEEALDRWRRHGWYGQPEPKKPPGVVLHSMRYYVPVQSEHDTVAEALEAAYWTVEDNRAAPVRITDRSGRVLLEGSAFDDALRQRGEQIEAAYEAAPPPPSWRVRWAAEHTSDTMP